MVPVRRWHGLARMGLWCAVVLGAVGGMVGMVRPAPPAPAAPALVGGTASSSASGFAALAVGAWLEATDETEAALGELFVDPPERWSGGSELVVRRTSSVSARELDPGYWAITVAADVTETDRAGEPLSSRWYFELGVVTAEEGRFLAASTPAVVPAPVASGSGWQVAGPTMGVPSRDDPMVATVEGFLAAFVAGAGDVSRYLAPGVSVVAVAPSPFTAVELDRLGAEPVAEGTRLLVSGWGVTASGGRVPVGYVLEAVERDGRWEITSVSGAPPLQRSTSSPSSTVPVGGGPSTVMSSTTSTTFASSPGA